MRFDRALAQYQPPGHSGVGESLCHESQDVVLTLGQPRQSVASHQVPDHMRVERRSAARHALDRGEEVGDV